MKRIIVDETLMYYLGPLIQRAEIIKDEKTRQRTIPKD